MKESHRIILARKPEHGGSPGFHYVSAEVYFYDIWLAMVNSDDAYQWGTINRTKDEHNFFTTRWGVRQVLEGRGGIMQPVEIGNENEAVGFAIHCALEYKHLATMKTEPSSQVKLRLVGGTDHREKTNE